MVVIGAVVILFAVSNRTPVTLDFWPLPFFLPTPLYLVVLAGTFLGFIFGGLVAWISAGSARSKARREKRRASSLEKDLTTLQEKIGALEDKSKDKNSAKNGSAP